MKVPRIDGKNIYLRGLNEADIPQMLVWVNNIEVTQYLELEPPITEIQEREWLLEMNHSSTDLVFGIVERDSDFYIGNIGIHNIDNSSKVANIGIFIGDHNQRGKGYGGEAVALVIQFVCKELTLNSINANIFSFNTKSIILFESLGFKKTGTAVYLKDGVNIDTKIYSFLCKDNSGIS